MDRTRFPRPSAIRILAAGVRAMAATVAASASVYLIARLVAAYPAGTLTAAAPSSGAPSLLAILGLSALASLTGAALLALLVQVAPRPGTIFLALAVAVYGGFFAGPLGLSAPLGTIVALEVMHLVVAGIVVIILGRALRFATAPEGRHGPGTSEDRPQDARLRPRSETSPGVRRA